MARIRATLDTEEFISTHRVGPTDFTRRRTLTFANVVTSLARGMTRSLQGELDDFFGRLANQTHLVRAVSKSAFSQARRKLLPSAFRALNDLLLDHWEQHVVVPRWHGFRLLAGDATTLRLPGLPEVIDEFGVHGDRWGGQTPMAQVFGLMDVTSGLLVHADMWPSSTRERAMLANSLAHVRANDMLLLDRGFPSYWLFAWLTERQRHFCMRVRDGVAGMGQLTRFFQSHATEAILQIETPVAALRKAAAQGIEIREPRFSIRVIRVRLPSGQEEFLVTSLLDSATFPAGEFADLYHRRWRIEECFKVLKCRLAVEHFSGVLPASIRQDFLAKAWLGNLVASFAYLAERSLPPRLKGRFLPNLTYAISAVRAILPRLMLGGANPARALRNLLKLIAHTLEWRRPDRSFPRTRQLAKPARHRAYKPV